MDIAELAIRVSVVADDVGTALQQAQQEAQEFGKKLEAVAQRPVDIQVNMGGLKEAGAELQAVAQRAATPIDVKIISTGDAKRLIAETETSVRNLAKAASKPIDVKLNAPTVIAAVENITRLGTEIDKAGSRLDTLKAKFSSPLKVRMMPDSTKKELEKEIQEVETLLDGLVEAQEAAIATVTGIAEEGGAKIALTFREAGQSIGDGLKAGGEDAKRIFNTIVESATETNSALQMVGKAGAEAGGQTVVGATMATVALKAQEVAAHSLQRVLKRMGTTLIGMGSGLLLGAVMGGVMSGVTKLIEGFTKAREEAEKLRQEQMKESGEAARKYTENAASIRKLSEEYAKLGGKIRSSSEDNSFLQLQGEIAEALGMTSDAIATQAGNVDYLLGKMAELAKANAALASAEYLKSANLLLASDEYTKAAEAYANARIIDLQYQGTRTKEGALEETKAKMDELGKQLAKDLINKAFEGAAAEGKAMAPDAREILTGILLDMQPDIADIDNMMNADQIKDAGAAAAHTLANVAQNIENDPQIATAIETVNGLYQKLLSGEISPEEYAEKGMAQAEVLTGLLAAAFEKAGVDAEIATPAVEAFRNAVVGDQWSLPTDKLLDFSKGAEASGRAAALAAAGYDELSKKTKETNDSIGKAKNLANHVKDANNAVSAYKKLSKEMKSSPAEIAKVNNAVGKLGMSFDGTDESLKNAEKGIGNFKASLTDQANALKADISSMEAEFAALGDAAYVDGVLTADASDLLAKIATSKEELAELIAMLKAANLFSGTGGGGGGGGKKDDAEKAAREAEQRRKDALEADYRMIEHKRHLNQITFEEELRMLEDIRKKHQMNAEEIMAWEEKVYDVKKAIRERDSGSIDKMADGVITALTNRYQAMLDAENDRLNASKKAWQQWSDDSVKAIQDQIDALDALSKTEDREKQDQEELRKIAKLRQDIEFEQDEYNRMKLQQQLDQAISSRDDRLRRQAIDDQKEALRAEITAIEERAATEIAALDEEQEALEKAYAERMKTAALQAEAEKLIMSSTQQELIDLIGEFAPEYDALGKTLGEKLLDGFKKKVGNVVDWFKKLNDSLYSIQEQAAADAIAASEAFYAAQSARQSEAASVPPATVVNQTVNFNEPVDSAGENARRLQQVNEDIGSLLYG